MEPFDLPTLDGLHLVTGLCDGVLTGTEALAGFQSLHTLPYTAFLGSHGVNVDTQTELIVNKMVGKRTFIGWPFLQEGLVIALSDSLFKYEKMAVVPGSQPKFISNPLVPHEIGHWKTNAERIETFYSEKLGVMVGSVNVLVHVRPLKDQLILCWLTFDYPAHLRSQVSNVWTRGRSLRTMRAPIKKSSRRTR
jgi:5'-3' exoribonuclease 1